MRACGWACVRVVVRVIYVAKPLSPSSLPFFITSPHTVKAGYIYASDRGHHRIQAFDKEGGFKFTIGAEGGKASSNNDGFNGERKLGGK